MTARRSLSLTLPIDSPELLKRVGAAFFGEPYWEHWTDLQPPDAPMESPDSTYSRGICLFRHENHVLRRLRKRLAEEFDQPSSHRFFESRYLPGEDADEALMRMFRLRQSLSMTDTETIEALAKPK